LFVDVILQKGINLILFDMNAVHHIWVCVHSIVFCVGEGDWDA